MTSKRKLSIRFRQLLPVIYPKLIRDGYKHKDCAKWLRDNHDLDITPALFTTYLNRYGNLKEEEEKYLKHLEDSSKEWWSPKQTTSQKVSTDDKQQSTSSSIDTRSVDEAESNNVSAEQVSNEQDTAGITSVTHYSSALNLGRDPSNNKYQDMEHPLDKIKKNKLRRATNKQTKKHKG